MGRPKVEDWKWHYSRAFGALDVGTKYTVRFWERIARWKTHAPRQRSARGRLGVVSTSALGVALDPSIPQFRWGIGSVTMSELNPIWWRVWRETSKKPDQDFRPDD